MSISKIIMKTTHRSRLVIVDFEIESHENYSSMSTYRCRSRNRNAWKLLVHVDLSLLVSKSHHMKTTRRCRLIVVDLVIATHENYMYSSMSTRRCWSRNRDAWKITTCRCRSKKSHRLSWWWSRPMTTCCKLIYDGVRWTI